VWSSGRSFRRDAVADVGVVREGRARGQGALARTLTWTTIAFLALLAAGCGGTSSRKAGGPGPVVRVAIANRAAQVRITASHAWRVRSVSESFDVAAGETWTFTHGGGRTLAMTDGQGRARGALGGELALHPTVRGARMVLDGAAYRGWFLLAARPNGLVVVNRLRLEDYVMGVVGNEIGKSGGARREALRAQAVAART